MTEAPSLEILALPVPPTDESSVAPDDTALVELEQRLDPRHPDYEQISWASVEDECRGLLATRRDLKLGLVLALALLKVRGLTGFGDGLRLLTHWVRNDQVWSTLTPSKLAGRINLLRELSAEYASEGELRFVRALYHLPLSDAGPEACLRHYEDGQRDLVSRLIASGGPGFRQEFVRSVAGCRSAAKDLCEALRARVPPEDSKNQSRVSGILQALLGLAPGDALPKEGGPLPGRGLLNQLERLARGGKIDTEETPGQRPEKPGQPGEPPATVAIRSQPEAIALLDSIGRYYEVHERSSPVPLLVRQARAMVDLGLPDIVQRLFGADDVTKISTLAGINPSEHSHPPAPPAPPAEFGDRRLERSGDIRSALESLIAFFCSNEPSSPIPIILTRARDLVDVPFDLVVGEFLGKDALARFNSMLGMKPPGSAK